MNILLMIGISYWFISGSFIVKNLRKGQLIPSGIVICSLAFMIAPVIAPSVILHIWMSRFNEALIRVHMEEK